MAIEDKSSAKDVIDNAIPLVLDAVDSLTADGLQSGFTRSDMGCADGGTSFCREILPPGTLRLGFSATAMHWLSAKPGDISNHVHMVGATGQELDAYRNPGGSVSVRGRVQTAWRRGEIRKSLHPDHPQLERKHLLQRLVAVKRRRRAPGADRGILLDLRAAGAESAPGTWHGLRPRLYGD